MLVYVVLAKVRKKMNFALFCKIYVSKKRVGDFPAMAGPLGNGGTAWLAAALPYFREDGAYSRSHGAYSRSNRAGPRGSTVYRAVCRTFRKWLSGWGEAGRVQATKNGIKPLPSLAFDAVSCLLP